MDITMIGKNIAAMRKEKGIKQDELASVVGVTPQAVSKWENGGVPDVELLPAIADYFGVSVDRLFGRNVTDYTDVRRAFAEEIAKIPHDEQMKRGFQYCWDMERAFFGETGPNDIEEFMSGFPKVDQTYSSIMNESGFTRMGIANRIQYFLLVPTIKDSNVALLNGIDYCSFFKDFSDKDVFNACLMLHKRESANAFTPMLLVKHMGVTVERAQEIMDVLAKWHLIHSTQIEMDDELQKVYTFRATPSFVALLIFAREMIDPPNHFNYYSGGVHAPYLK